MPPYTNGEAGHAIARIPASGPLEAARLAASVDDDLLAGILICMWMLASGRSLRPGVRPEQLSVEELIDFWADDMTPGNWPPRGTAGSAEDPVT